MIKNNHTASLDEEIEVYKRFIHKKISHIDALVTLAKQEDFQHINDERSKTEIKELSTLSPYLTVSDLNKIKTSGIPLTLKKDTKQTFDKIIKSFDYLKITRSKTIDNRLKNSKNNVREFRKKILNTEVIAMAVIVSLSVIINFFQHDFHTINWDSCIFIGKISLAVSLFVNCLVHLLLASNLSYKLEEGPLIQHIAFIRSTYHDIGFLNYYRKTLCSIEHLTDPSSHTEQFETLTTHSSLITPQPVSE